MKKIIAIMTLVLILVTTFSTPAFAGIGRVWVGSVAAQRAQVDAAVAKLDVLLTAYTNSSEPEKLVQEIEKAAVGLSESLERFAEELEEVFDDLSEDEQNAIRDTLDSLYYDDLVPLAEKGNALFGENSFIVSRPKSASFSVAQFTLF